jgi:4'-phosphopantetheinyl transferase EntD
VSAAFSASAPDARLAADLFPNAVATLVSAIDASIADLQPEERPAIARAVPKRQREFATGRRAAREALATLGLPPVALLRNADRTCAWPAGVVGSISHCDELCAVAVAPRGAIVGLGVDVEPDAPLERALWSRICTPREIERFVEAERDPAEQGCAARLVFCAKEAFYKSVAARVGRVLGFQEVEIQVDRENGRFLAWLEGTPTGAPAGTSFEGRFARRAGFVLAGATLHLAETEGTRG